MNIPPDDVHPEGEQSPLHPENEQAEYLEQRRAAFRKRLDDAVELPTQCGASVSLMVSTLEDVLRGSPPLYEHVVNGPDGPKRMHPASTIKVAQAIFLASRLSHLTPEQLTDERVVDWSDFATDQGKERGDFITGGGEYDKPKYKNRSKLRHASYNGLFEDMLGANSGNMAAKILMGRNSIEDFNAFWKEKAPTVRLAPAGERGWFTIDDVLPSDMLRVMAFLSELDDTPVAQEIRSALTGGSGKSGTVSGAFDSGSREHLLTKTGDLPPDEDDPYHTLHDIGQVGDYVYVIMTQSPGNRALDESQQMIEKVGAYIAHEKGYATTERARRKLGGDVLGRVGGLIRRSRS